MHPSDIELVEKAKKGDKQAFVVLFDRYKDKILRYLHGYMGDYYKAQDATVETFMGAYKYLHTYAGKGSFASWLYTIATNVAKRELIKTRDLKEVSLNKPIDKEETIALGDLIMDNEKRPDFIAKVTDLEEFVHKILAEMEEKYRKPILLCDLQGMSYEEAAEVLGWNKMTVGTRLKRGRKRFYQILKKYRSEL